MTFNILDFISERSYPEREITIIQDSAALHDLKGGHYSTDEEKAALEERVKNSAVIFSIRGFSPEKAQSIYAKWTKKDKDSTPALPAGTETAEQAANFDLVANTIVSARVGDQVDDHKWTAEEISKLALLLNPKETEKLISAVMDVTFESAVYDEETDAGFLSGATDETAELGDKASDSDGSGDEAPADDANISQ